jgi:hypothetical protein
MKQIPDDVYAALLALRELVQAQQAHAVAVLGSKGAALGALAPESGRIACALPMARMRLDERLVGWKP